MNMEIIFLKHGRINLMLLADRADITHTDNGRFLHHISHLSGQINISLTRHDIYLNL